MEIADINEILDVFILFSLLVTAVAVISAKNLITSTVLLAAFSLLMAAEYLVLGAPDVAITEAAVGAGISSILLLLALFLVGDEEKKGSKNKLFLPFIVVTLVTFGLVYATFDMPSFGNKYAPAQLHVSPYYLENATAETGMPNMVTSILASYRGFDTLGEAVVILTAAIAVMLLLGKFVRRKEDEQ